MNYSVAKSLDVVSRKILFHSPPLTKYSVNANNRFGGPLAYFGNGHIEGTTSVAGNPNLPKSCPVRAYVRETGQFVREVTSSETGVYRFENIKVGVDYTLIAIDETNQYNAVIADRLRAKP